MSAYLNETTLESRGFTSLAPITNAELPTGTNTQFVYATFASTQSLSETSYTLKVDAPAGFVYIDVTCPSSRFSRP